MWFMSQDGFYRVLEDGSVVCMNIPWQPYVGDSGDETQSVEEVYQPKKIDPKDMSVKADTPEDLERLWDSVKDYARS